ncbi:hypothetical protein RM572_19840 [Streptomyces sp. DSM 42041]|uniref:DUF3592 domain-containing protein n=1 Tax=Streptomyces hazeniae TaxID=3075538 RepID=A0ABU2NWC4_9ACTN|nr:hypothetical protein [Streptomyces sp. DSM 42041]MDT0381010.1 hypothetical protein [Streptomyces sp. DSM 42041]
MNTGSRAVAMWLTLAAFGFIAVFVVMSERFSAATPRWDLIACFAVTAVGVVGCLVTVRGKRFTAFGGIGSLPWWPDLRAVWRGLFVPVSLMTLVYFVGGIVNVSPAALRMVEEGHVIATVEVDDVLSSERERGSRGERYYSVRVRASVPYNDGDTTRVWEFDSRQRVEAGDEVWALYAPSRPDLGAFLEEDRGQLEQKAGGPPANIPYMILTIFSALLVAALAYSAPGLPRHVRRALREGRVRRMSVRPTGGTAVMFASDSANRNRKGRNDEPELKPTPCLLLCGPAGERIRAVVGKGIDPIAAAKALEDRHDHTPVTIHWIASGEGAGKGVLLWGRHYLRCRSVTDADGESLLTDGESALRVAGQRRPREVRRVPEWRSDLHVVGFGWTLFILLLLGVIAFGVGLIATIVLACIVALAGLVVLYGASAERAAELSKLIPESRDEDSGHASDEGPPSSAGEGAR